MNRTWWWMVVPALVTACSGGGDDSDTDTDGGDSDVAQDLPDGPIDATETGTSWTSKGGFELTWTVTPFPAEVGDAALALTVKDRDGAFAGEDVTVTPWMPQHGHGAPGGATVTESDLGSWDATWEYSMPGYWEVTVEVGPKDELVLAFDL